MTHAIQVELVANIDKYKSGMDAAKQIGSDSLGFIASIFDKIKSMFSGIWNSITSVFSGAWDKIKGFFGSVSDSASGAFQKIAGYFPGLHNDLDKTKTKMSETEEKSSSLASKIGTTLVAAFVVFSATVTAMVAKGLNINTVFAGIATSSDIAVSQISRFSDAAARSGVDVKTLGDSMSKFRDAMSKAAAGDGGDVFSKLGVTVVDSKNALLQTDDVLIKTAKSISNMGSEAEKYAAASKIGFEGKVQVLEDIAHASDLAATKSDDQAAAVVRLGKIWHEILPSGQSMWSEVSDKLTNALTPAMTTASVAILESKNRIVDAFNQIYGGGSMFDKLADKIKDWASQAAGWFSSVEKKTTDMTISIMKFIAAKTGLGNADSYKDNGGGYVPKQVPLTDNKSDPITKAAQKAATDQYDQLTKAINDKIAAQRLESQTGAVLTDGQRSALQLMTLLRDGNLDLTDSEKQAAAAQAKLYIDLENSNKAMLDAKAKQEAADKKEQDSYVGLIASIQSKIESNKLELTTGQAVTDSQKMQADMDAKLASGKLILSANHEKVARAALQELGVTEQQLQASKDYDAAMKAINAAGDGDLKSLDDEIAKQKEHNAEIGLTREQIELVRQAQAEAQTEDLKREQAAIDALLNQADLQGILIGKDRDLYAARLAYLDKEISKRQTLAGLHAEGATAEANAQALADAAAAQKKLADMAIQDWKNVGSSIADSLSTAFGTAGNAIGQMFKAYSDGIAGQLKAQKELAAAKDLLDRDPTKAAQIQQAQLAGTQAQIKSYGDMAEAAQGFFDKGSSGYRAMAAATEVLRLAEVGLSLIKGVNAVLTQGEGDPYSAFARMAAMTALVAGLGVAISGSGSGASSAQRQADQGTGTVLGSSSAKSDSINKAIELTAANSSTQINYLSGLLTTLKTIQSDITSFTSELVQTTDITNPNVGSLNSNNGLATNVMEMAAGGIVGEIVAKLIPGVGNVVGKLATAIFGGKQTVDDSGFTLDKTTLASVLANGVSAQSYADITTSGGLFHGDSKSTKTADLGADADRQFTSIITSLASSITQASSLLGVSGDAFTNQLNSFVIDIGNVSLKGLSGDDLTNAINAVFSKLGDQMAEAAIPDLTQFQQVGEGYLETLVRVASDYAKVDASLQSIGKTFGSVGVESIAARENLISLMGGIDDFQSKTADFASNFLTKAQQMAPVQAYVTEQLASMNLGWVQTREQFAGVIQSLDLTTTSGQATYAALMNLESAFASVTSSVVDTTMSQQDIADQRKDLQDQLDDATMTSEQLRAKELSTIDASNVALYNQVQAAKTASSMLDLQGQVYQALGDKAGAAAVLEQQHALALAQTDPALRDLTQQLWDVQAAAQAATDVKDAGAALLTDVDNSFSVLQKVVEREKAVVQTSVDTHQAAVDLLQGLSDAVKSALSSMETDSQKLTDRTRAQAEIRADLAIQQAGGTLSSDQVDSLKTALGSVTTDASSTFSSYSDYMRDLLETQNDISALGSTTDTQLSVEQAALKAAQDQLTALDAVVSNAQAQIDELKGQSTTLLSIDQASRAVLAAITAANTNPVNASTGAINDAYQTVLGRTPDASGLAYWQGQAATGISTSAITSSIANSREAQIDQLYESIFNRPADAAGLSYWFNSSASISEIAASMKQSDEYKALHPFAVGTNYVPETMPALVHQGERIIPAADNRDLMARLASPATNNDALVAEIRALKAELVEIRKSSKQIEGSSDRTAKSTRQHADQFDQVTAGGNAMLTEGA